MLLRKYIVKCNIDLEHNRVSMRDAGAEFMNPLHNSFNWIFQISHHTQIINSSSWGKLASELLGPFFFNFVLHQHIQAQRLHGTARICPEDLCLPRVGLLNKSDFFRLLTETFDNLKGQSWTPFYKSLPVWQIGVTHHHRIRTREEIRMENGKKGGK